MADDKVKVKFLRDEVYETEGRNQGKTFTAGRVYSMTADQAGRWVRRDAAELVEDAADEEDGPPKPKRGRPPKAKAGEAFVGDDDAEDEEDEDDEPAPPEPPRPPMPPVRQPEPVKPEPPKDPGPRHVTSSPLLPPKAPDKGR